MKITLKDGSVKEYSEAMSVKDIAFDIAPGLGRAACAGEVNGEVVDLRTTIEDVELVKDTLDHCIELLKGRKQDIAELDSGELFMVGTLGNNINGKPLARNGDFIGEVIGVDIDIDSFINNKVSQLETLGFVFENTKGSQEIKRHQSKS